jgi:hypothetical protein
MQGLSGCSKLLHGAEHSSELLPTQQLAAADQVQRPSKPVGECSVCMLTLSAPVLLLLLLLLLLSDW